VIVGFSVLGVLVVIAVLVGIGASRYQKAKPDEALVATGRGGQKITIGGGMFVMPIVQQMFRLDLSAQTISVEKAGVITRNRVPINVHANVVYKIRGEIEAVKLAAQSLWGSQASSVSNIVQSIAEGAFRDICGKMSPEEINEDRTTFANNVTENVTGHLEKIGIDLITFVVNHIEDEQGYFKALGAEALAEAKQNARQKTAIADREAVITEVEQQRDSEVRSAETEAERAAATKEKDVKVAQFLAEVEAEKARAGQAGPKATAVATQEVVEEQTKLAEREAERREAELKGEKIKPAEAERRAAVVAAEGTKQAAVLKGQGEGEAAKAVGEGEAAAIKAKLMAEAEGLERKATAMKEFNAAGYDLELGKYLLDKMPEMVREAAAAVTKIEAVKIVHFTGGSNGNEGSPIDSVLNSIPRVLATVDESMKSTIGSGVKDLLPKRKGREEE